LRIYQKLLLLAAVLGLVGCDHATKHWAKATLRAVPRLDLVPGILDLRLTANTDTAFSLLGAIPADIRLPLILIAQLLATAAIIRIGLVMTRRSRHERSYRYELGGYALVVAGAAGNFFDRLLRGHVVDFIHLQHWPVFNVADMCIVAGGLLLALVYWRRAPRPPPPVDRARAP